MLLRRLAGKTAKYIKHAISGPKNRTSDGFPLDAWNDETYAAWFEAHKSTPSELAKQRETVFSYQPKFSIIVPLYKTPLNFLEDVVASVRNQSYGSFELVLVNGSPEIRELCERIDSLCKEDGRIKVVTLEKNRGITENTNAGLAVSEGNFACFLDHDDFISPDLLFEYAVALNNDSEIDLLYCDEDLVDTQGRHVHPLFKPALSPELLISKNYVVHMMTVRRSLLDDMPRPSAIFDGAQDFNMVLYASEKARKVHHVPKVLYHWRMSDVSTAANPNAKSYSKRAYRLSIANHLERTDTLAALHSSGLINIYNPWFSNHEGPCVSVLVDARGTSADLDRFVEFFLQTNSYLNFEIVAAVPPDKADFDAPKDFACPVKLAIINEDIGIFACYNACAKEATGDYLLLADTDCVFSTSEPLEQLVGLCQREGIGAVAPKTLYADTSNRCYGIAVTPQCILPLHHGYPDDHPGYQCNIRALQNFSAVSYRGMITPRAVFNATDGFDEGYESEIGNVDYCHRLLLANLRVVQTPTVKVVTLESFPGVRYSEDAISTDFSDADLALFDQKWPGVRAAGDPYFNRNLDQTSCWYQLPQGN